MKRYTINLTNYESLEESLEDIYSILELPKSGSLSVQSLKVAMNSIHEDIVIELIQKTTMHEKLIQLVDVFESVQRKNDHVYLIIGIQ